MNGKTENGEVVKVNVNKMIFYPVVMALALAILSGAFDVYSAVSEGPRYTQDEADADNHMHNRRLCAIEEQLFERTLGDCE